MLQQERRIYLIKELLKEQQEKIKIPKTSTLQKQLLRALFNIRLPKEASNEFLKIQDEYLQEEMIILLKLTNHSDYADQLFRYP